MEVFRLSRKKYAHELSGMGAAMRGGRWNSRGIEMLYTASSRALAMSEVLVYLSMETLPDDFIMLTIAVPEDLPVEALPLAALPTQWNEFPHLPYTRKFGDEFIRHQKACVLKVPSAVVPGDFNFLINPHHPGFSRISITGLQDFPFDKRLF